jgi:hypothetical protein
MISDPTMALLAIDERLYRGYARFSPITPNGTSRVVFDYEFPAGLPLGSYIGNAFIFEQLGPPIGPISPIYDRWTISVEII